MIRLLAPADDAAMRAFLMPRAASSMFVLSNSLAAGLVDEGKPLQGTYVAAFEAGELTGVAAHFWYGMVVVQDDHAILFTPNPAAARADEAIGFRRIGDYALVMQ